MAKLGNEARLLLKLARERADVLKTRRLSGPFSVDHYGEGYRQCFDDIWAIFDQAVQELKGKG